MVFRSKHQDLEEDGKSSISKDEREDSTVTPVTTKEKRKTGFEEEKDPFDDENSDVKFKTMSWWYVSSLCICI